jgi:hypothetical protein
MAGNTQIKEVSAQIFLDKSAYHTEAGRPKSHKSWVAIE